MSSRIAGTILIVDDEPITRLAFGNWAAQAGIDDFETLKDAESTVTRLNELQDTAAAVFTDGLEGRWKDVVTVANELGIPAFVVSASTDLQPDVEAAGAVFIPKANLPKDFIAIALGDLPDPVAA